MSYDSCYHKWKQFDAKRDSSHPHGHQFSIAISGDVFVIVFVTVCQFHLPVHFTHVSRHPNVRC